MLNGFVITLPKAKFGGAVTHVDFYAVYPEGGRIHMVGNPGKANAAGEFTRNENFVQVTRDIHGHEATAFQDKVELDAVGRNDPFRFQDVIDWLTLYGVYEDDVDRTQWIPEPEPEPEPEPVEA